MAVNAKFQADFSSFLTAVQQAEVKLRTFEEGAGKAGAAVNKMANSLSGNTIIQQATVMAEAVARVGGVAMLTEKELAKLGPTAQEAAAKLTAMGQKVPPEIQRIADAAKNIQPALSAADKAASLLTSTFAQFTLAGLATKAISSLASSVGEFATIGFTKLPAVQASFSRLTGAIKIDGAEMLENMNTATKGMVANYDLMLSANKAMLLGLPVTNESMADLAKTASVLGKAMGQDATKSLDDLITALGRSSPMILDNLGLSVKVGEANETYAKSLGKSAEALTEAEKKTAFYNAAMEAARKKTEELGDQTRTLSEIAGSVWAHIGDAISSEAARINNSLSDEQKYAERFLKKIGFDATRSAEEFGDLSRAIDTVMGKMDKLSNPAAAPKQAPAGVTTLHLSIDDLLTITDGLEQEQKALDKAAEAAKKHADAIDSLFRRYSGADATAAIQDLDAVFRRLADSGQLTQKQIDAIVKEALKLQSEGGKLTQRLWDTVRATDALNPGLNTVALDFGKIGTQVEIVIPKIDKVWEQLNKPVPFGISHLKDEFAALVVRSPADMLKDVQVQSVDAGKAIGDLAQSFAQLGQIATGSLGGIVRTMGAFVSSIDVANKSLKSFADGKKAFDDGHAIAGIASMTSGILGLASAALSAGKAIANLFDRNKGRDLVNEFADSFRVFDIDTMTFGDGYEELHRQLNGLGAEGEKLWIALTQGVGRNNPEQARGVIEAINKALAAQKGHIEAAAGASSDAAAAQQKELDAISAKYSEVIGRLDSEYKSLSASIGREAEEEFMGIVETQERARLEQVKSEKAAQEAMRDAEIEAKKTTFDEVFEAGKVVDGKLRELFGKPLDIPYRYVAQNEPGSATYNPAAQQSGGGTLTLNNQVFVDGRQVTEAVGRRVLG